MFKNCILKILRSIFCSNATDHSVVLTRPPSISCLSFIFLFIQFWSVPLRVCIKHPWSPPPRAGRPLQHSWSAGSQCLCWWGNPPGGCTGSNKLHCWKSRAVLSCAASIHWVLNFHRSRPLMFPSVPSVGRVSAPPLVSPSLALPPDWHTAPGHCRASWSGAVEREASETLPVDEAASGNEIWWWGEPAGRRLPRTGQRCTAHLVAQDRTQTETEANLLTPAKLGLSAVSAFNKLLLTDDD